MVLNVVLWALAVGTADAQLKVPPLPPLAPATPVDAYAALAGLAAAVAVAYASLPSFRHRLSVQQYVRVKVKKARFLGLLKSQSAEQAKICQREDWAILHRLGALADEEEMPPPVKAKIGSHARLADWHFDGNLSFQVYRLLFASNLDKMIAIFLGAMASSVIWFGAIDRESFITPQEGELHRSIFISNMVEFYLLAFSLGIIAATLHAAIWRWDMKRGTSQYRWMTGSKIIATLLFFISLFFASSGYLLFSDLVYKAKVYPQSISSFIIQTVLFLTILVPLLLLWLAEQLTATMKAVIDMSVDSLTDEFGEAATQATLTPPE